MIKIPGMLMVGAGDINAGKTEFACSLIRKFSSKHNILAVKVTTVEQADGTCPRGNLDCGVCSTLEGNYSIAEETDKHSDKDTCRMLAAGAVRVFWLKVLKTHLKEGINALYDIIGNDVFLVCESNSLRRVVQPDLFIMLKGSKTKNSKTSAKDVARFADKMITFDGKSFDVDLDEFELLDGRWVSKMHATAIIMAGGKSGRMGQDKSMLMINGKPLIKHIFDQLNPHFSQILVSSEDTSMYNFLGVKVVPDIVSGKGPLMGISSALKASENDVNFVIACDIPEVDIGLVRRMVRESHGFDAVVPQIGPSKCEPLFAVYKKSTLNAIDKAIDSQNYRIVAPLKDCKVNYIDLTCDLQLKNLNTMSDYLKFVSRKIDT